MICFNTKKNQYNNIKKAMSFNDSPVSSTNLTEVRIFPDLVVMKMTEELHKHDDILRLTGPINNPDITWYNDYGDIDYNHCLLSIDLKICFARRRYFVKTFEIHYYIINDELIVKNKFYEIDYDESRHETTFSW